MFSGQDELTLSPMCKHYMERLSEKCKVLSGAYDLWEPCRNYILSNIDRHREVNIK